MRRQAKKPSGLAGATRKGPATPLSRSSTATHDGDGGVVKLESGSTSVQSTQPPTPCSTAPSSPRHLATPVSESRAIKPSAATAAGTLVSGTALPSSQSHQYLSSQTYKPLQQQQHQHQQEPPHTATPQIHESALSPDRRGLQSSRAAASGISSSSSTAPLEKRPVTSAAAAGLPHPPKTLVSSMSARPSSSTILAGTTLTTQSLTSETGVPGVQHSETHATQGRSSIHNSADQGIPSYAAGARTLQETTQNRPARPSHLSKEDSEEVRKLMESLDDSVGLGSQKPYNPSLPSEPTGAQPSFALPRPAADQPSSTLQAPKASTQSIQVETYKILSELDSELLGSSIASVSQPSVAQTVPLPSKAFSSLEGSAGISQEHDGEHGEIKVETPKDVDVSDLDKLLNEVTGELSASVDQEAEGHIETHEIYSLKQTIPDSSLAGQGVVNIAEEETVISSVEPTVERKHEPPIFDLPDQVVVSESIVDRAAHKESQSSETPTDVTKSFLDLQTVAEEEIQSGTNHLDAVFRGPPVVDVSLTSSEDLDIQGVSFTTTTGTGLKTDSLSPSPDFGAGRQDNLDISSVELAEDLGTVPDLIALQSATVEVATGIRQDSMEHQEWVESEALESTESFASESRFNVYTEAKDELFAISAGQHEPVSSSNKGSEAFVPVAEIHEQAKPSLAFDETEVIGSGPIELMAPESSLVTEPVVYVCHAQSRVPREEHQPTLLAGAEFDPTSHFERGEQLQPMYHPAGEGGDGWGIPGTKQGMVSEEPAMVQNFGTEATVLSPGNDFAFQDTQNQSTVYAFDKASTTSALARTIGEEGMSFSGELETEVADLVDQHPPDSNIGTDLLTDPKPPSPSSAKEPRDLFINEDSSEGQSLCESGGQPEGLPESGFMQDSGITPAWDLAQDDIETLNMNLSQVVMVNSPREQAMCEVEAGKERMDPYFPVSQQRKIDDEFEDLVEKMMEAESEPSAGADQAAAIAVAPRFPLDHHELSAVEGSKEIGISPTDISWAFEGTDSIPQQSLGQVGESNQFEWELGTEYLNESQQEVKESAVREAVYSVADIDQARTDHEEVTVLKPSFEQGDTNIGDQEMEKIENRVSASFRKDRDAYLSEEGVHDDIRHGASESFFGLSETSDVSEWKRNKQVDTHGSDAERWSQAAEERKLISSPQLQFDQPAGDENEFNLRFGEVLSDLQGTRAEEDLPNIALTAALSDIGPRQLPPGLSRDAGIVELDGNVTHVSSGLTFGDVNSESIQVGPNEPFTYEHMTETMQRETAELRPEEISNPDISTVGHNPIGVTSTSLDPIHRIPVENQKQVVNDLGIELAPQKHEPLYAAAEESKHVRVASRQSLDFSHDMVPESRKSDIWFRGDVSHGTEDEDIAFFGGHASESGAVNQNMEAEPRSEQDEFGSGALPHDDSRQGPLAPSLLQAGSAEFAECLPSMGYQDSLASGFRHTTDAEAASSAGSLFISEATSFLSPQQGSLRPPSYPGPDSASSIGTAPQPPASHLPTSVMRPPLSPIISHAGMQSSAYVRPGAPLTGTLEDMGYGNLTGSTAYVSLESVVPTTGPPGIPASSHYPASSGNRGHLKPSGLSEPGQVPSLAGPTSEKQGNNPMRSLLPSYYQEYSTRQETVKSPTADGSKAVPRSPFFSRLAGAANSALRGSEVSETPLLSDDMYDVATNPSYSLQELVTLESESELGRYRQSRGSGSTGLAPSSEPTSYTTAPSLPNQTSMEASQQRLSSPPNALVSPPQGASPSMPIRRPNRQQVPFGHYFSADSALNHSVDRIAANVPELTQFSSVPIARAQGDGLSPISSHHPSLPSANMTNLSKERPRVHPLLAFGSSGKIVIHQPRKKRHLNVLDHTAPAEYATDTLRVYPCLIDCVKQNPASLTDEWWKTQGFLERVPSGLPLDLFNNVSLIQQWLFFVESCANQSSGDEKLAWKLISLELKGINQQILSSHPSASFGWDDSNAVVDILLENSTYPDDLSRLDKISSRKEKDIDSTLCHGRIAEAVQLALDNRAYDIALLLAAGADPSLYFRVVTEMSAHRFAPGSGLQVYSAAIASGAMSFADAGNAFQWHRKAALLLGGAMQSKTAADILAELLSLWSQLRNAQGGPEHGASELACFVVLQVWSVRMFGAPHELGDVVDHGKNRDLLNHIARALFMIVVSRRWVAISDDVSRARVLLQHVSLPVLAQICKDMTSFTSDLDRIDAWHASVSTLLESFSGIPDLSMQERASLLTSLDMLLASIYSESKRGSNTLQRSESLSSLSGQLEKMRAYLLTFSPSDIAEGSNRQMVHEQRGDRKEFESSDIAASVSAELIPIVSDGGIHAIADAKLETMEVYDGMEDAIDLTPRDARSEQVVVGEREVAKIPSIFEPVATASLVVSQVVSAVDEDSEHFATTALSEQIKDHDTAPVSSNLARALPSPVLTEPEGRLFVSPPRMYSDMSGNNIPVSESFLVPSSASVRAPSYAPPTLSPTDITDSTRPAVLSLFPTISSKGPTAIATLSSNISDVQSLTSARGWLDEDDLLLDSKETNMDPLITPAAPTPDFKPKIRLGKGIPISSSSSSLTGDVSRMMSGPISGQHSYHGAPKELSDFSFGVGVSGDYPDTHAAETDISPLAVARTHSQSGVLASRVSLPQQDSLPVVHEAKAPEELVSTGLSGAPYTSDSASRVGKTNRFSRLSHTQHTQYQQAAAAAGSNQPNILGAKVSPMTPMTSFSSLMVRPPGIEQVQDSEPSAPDIMTTSRNDSGESAGQSITSTFGLRAPVQSRSQPSTPKHTEHDGTSLAAEDSGSARKWSGFSLLRSRKSAAASAAPSSSRPGDSPGPPPMTPKPPEKPLGDPKSSAGGAFHTRSASVDDLKRAASANPPSATKPMPATTQNSAAKAPRKDSQKSGGWGVGSLGEKLRNLVGAPKRAHMGTTNKFYYNEKLGRWVVEGEEDQAAEEMALPPPPTDNEHDQAWSESDTASATLVRATPSVAAEQGTLLFSTPSNMALPGTLNLASNAAGGATGNAFAAEGELTPSSELPSSYKPNRFSARALMQPAGGRGGRGGGSASARSRYVDTFASSNPSSAQTSASKSKEPNVLPSPQPMVANNLLARPAGGFQPASGYKVFVPAPHPMSSFDDEDSGLQAAEGSVSQEGTRDAGAGSSWPPPDTGAN